MIILRPDQAKQKSDIYAAWESCRNVLAVLPTGGGKSIIVSDIVLDFSMMNRRGVVIAHRNELVSQMSMHLANRGIVHRIIGPDTTIRQIIAEHRKAHGKSFVHPDAPISVAGVDTLVARADSLKAWAAQQSFWIIDEAHHVLAANKWGTAAAMFVNAIGLGVTASPCRADGRGLGSHVDGVFDVMICGPTMRQLIELGALTDYEIAIAESDLILTDDDIGESGDFSPKKMKEAAARSHIVGDVVKEYIARAFGKRAICFATDVDKAKEIAENFKAWGIPAASVSAKSSADYRRDMIERFRNGSIMVLVNVDLFGEGFDVPACEVVIMARPTASLAVYLQQFGRALRTMQGKLFGLIIDHVGNWKRHGFPDKPHAWSLDRREKRSKGGRDPHDLKVCPNCTKPHEMFHAACPYCLFKPQPPEGGARDIQIVDGNLVLLNREMLEQMREAIELENPADVGDRVAFAAGNVAAKGAVNRQIAKIVAQNQLKEAIAQWAAIKRANGQDDETSYKWFYLKTGVDVLSALSKERSRDEFEKMTAQVKGWYEYA